MIMQKMRRAEHAPLKSLKPDFTPTWAPTRSGSRPFAVSTPVDGFSSAHASAPTGPFKPDFASLCFVDLFFRHIATARLAQALHVMQVIRQPLAKERSMKLQFGKNQLVLELSASPFAWFHGQTERMSLTSLSLLFVQFSLFAHQPAA
jgi:hypothetical protein